MKFKYTGDQDAIEIRGITFKRGKPVEVPDASLAQKLTGLPYFTQAKVKTNDKNVS